MYVRHVRLIALQFIEGFVTLFTFYFTDRAFVSNVGFTASEFLKEFSVKFDENFEENFFSSMSWVLLFVVNTVLA